MVDPVRLYMPGFILVRNSPNASGSKACYFIHIRFLEFLVLLVKCSCASGFYDLLHMLLAIFSLHAFLIVIIDLFLFLFNTLKYIRIIGASYCLI